MSKKVLVVDDSPADLANLKSILMDAGCIVATASNGKDAVNIAKQEKPAAVFLDIVMPDMSGFEVCKALADDPATKAIPVVFVSSKGEKADKVWGQMQGGRGHIAKPFTPEQIIDQLKVVA